MLLMNKLVYTTCCCEAYFYRVVVVYQYPCTEGTRGNTTTAYTYGGKKILKGDDRNKPLKIRLIDKINLSFRTVPPLYGSTTVPPPLLTTFFVPP